MAASTSALIPASDAPAEENQLTLYNTPQKLGDKRSNEPPRMSASKPTKEARNQARRLRTAQRTPASKDRHVLRGRRAK